MANIKFSAFTQKVVQTNVDFLVGYTGADNVRITPAALGDGIYLPLGGGTMVGNVIFNDSVKALFGTGSDLEIYHSTDSKIDNTNGDLYIRNFADDKDIYFACDDGSGGVETYFYLDGSAGGANPFTVFPDNSNLTFGTGYDLRQYHNGTDSYLDNYEGNLVIRNYYDDGDIIFYSDDGSGGTAQYFRVDGSLVETGFVKNTHHYDNVKANFGDGNDLEIYHDGSDSYISDGGTGDLIISGGNDIIFKDAVGNLLVNMNQSDSVELYYGGVKKLETTATGIEVTDEVSIGTNLVHTGDTDTKLAFGTNNITLIAGGATYLDCASDQTTHLYSGNAFALSLDASQNATFAGDVEVGKANGEINFSSGNGYVQTTTGSSSLVFGTNSTERMRIHSSGNVGIGATVPTSKLSISGSQTAIDLTRGTAGDSKWGFSSDSTALYIAELSTGSTDYIMTFKETTGNVGIGTTTPTAALQVVGLVEYADNAAALTAGLTAGAFYRTGDLLKVVH